MVFVLTQCLQVHYPGTAQTGLYPLEFVPQGHMKTQQMVTRMSKQDDGTGQGDVLRCLGTAA